jgi:ArsR family transcriptional regulator
MKCDKTIKENIVWNESSEDIELANLTKALGNVSRLRILKMLIKRNSCVCSEIVDELPLSQSTVSQHLKVLKDVGLIQGTIKGINVCYCINPDVLKKLKLLVVAL